MRRAFTLLEVILAISLGVMLVAAMGSFAWNLLDRRATLLGVGRDVHAAAALIDRIEGDLLGAVAGDAKAGAGVQGTSTRLRLLTRGVWLAVGAGAGGAAAGDLQRSEYRFDPATARLTAARAPAGAAPGRDGRGEPEVVSERVERLRLRYFDGREWLDSFDSLASGTLPVAVEVAIWMAAPGAAPVTGSDLAEPGRRMPARTPGQDIERDSMASLPDAPATEESFDDRRWGEPDRLRIIVVPDGPVTAFREGA